jgi:hypothetical protein
MAYTDNTKDNQAVQLLIEGEKIRVDSLGAASLGLYSGIIQFTLSIEARTDSAAAYVRVYDSGDLNDDCEVKLSTSSATITDNGGARTATSLTGYSVTGARRYTWLDTLTTPVGEWVIEVSTAANTGSTPLVFSRFHAEEASVIGDGTVTEDKLALNSVTRAKIADDAVGSAELDEDAVLRAHFADAAGMPGTTRAALFEPGIAASMQRCSFAFDLTNATDLTVRFKRRGLSLPAASTERLWAGRSGTDQPNIALKNTAGVYTVEMREVSTSLLAYTWTDDLEEHEWEFRYASTGCAILLDGASVASGVTAGSLDLAAFQFAIGTASTAATVFTSDHATYRDVEVIDPATATNKVFLRLDEPAGGPYYNAYLRLGDPLYDATNTSAVTIATTGTDTSRPKSARMNSVDGGAGVVQESDRPRPVRVAAFSGLGNHATAGQFGLVSWAPTGTPAFNVRLNLARQTASPGTCVVWGRVAASYANIEINSDGSIDARVNTTNVCTSAAVLQPDGRVRDVLVEFRDSGADVTAAIYLGTRLIASGTLAATQFSAVAADHYVGGNTGARRWSGSISNVLLEDLNSAANSGFYLMDEPRGSTTYANTYPGTSLAGLTINGFVSSCGVESEDGKGRPWQGAQPLVYLAQRDGTIQTIDGSAGASATLTFNAEVLDPTGSLSVTAGWTAPCDGIARFSYSGSFSNSTLDDVTLYILRAGGIAGTVGATLLVGSMHNLALTCAVAVTAGQVWYPFIDAVDVGNTALRHNLSQFMVEFTPTTVAG